MNWPKTCRRPAGGRAALRRSPPPGPEVGRAASPDRAGPSAEWYSLLGVIDLAAGRAGDAEASFRRALYLDPDHREALTHLAMLCERRGDAGPASGLRRRLARLPEATA